MELVTVQMDITQYNKVCYSTKGYNTIQWTSYSTKGYNTMQWTSYSTKGYNTMQWS